MLSLFRRRSRFAKALARYGLERCSMSRDQLWIGLKPHADYGRVALDAMPESFKAICFVQGPEQAELVKEFVASPECAEVSFLMIGTSHDYRSPAGPIDISSAVAALGGAAMPALKRLSLGDMEKLFNGHAYYGRVGDITPVFDLAPNLTSLVICGCAALTRPVEHRRLEEWHMRLDDIGVSGGPLSQATLDNTLTSRLPNLRTLELALDEQDAQPYSVNEAFFADNGFPALERFGIDRLDPEGESRLRAWAAERTLRWTL